MKSNEILSNKFGIPLTIHYSLVVGYYFLIFGLISTLRQIVLQPSIHVVVIFLVWLAFGFVLHKILRGANWARMVYLSIFIVVSLALPLILMAHFQNWNQNYYYFLVAVIISYSLCVLSIILLFSKSSNLWFRSQATQS